MSRLESVEKRKIRASVKWYKTTHSEEYAAFCTQMNLQRNAAVSDFAQVEGSPHRMLHEIPETMFDFMVKLMTVEEMEWFSTIKANTWFVKTFPEFSAARII